MRDNCLRSFQRILVVSWCALLTGCAQWYAADADRQVYDLIDRRQDQALSIRADAHAGKPTGPPRVGSEGYAFVPHPLDPAVPETFTRTDEPTASAPAEEQDRTQTQPISDEDEVEPLVMSFQEVIAYAFKHSRDFQSDKEDLYLSALALTLERFLWTPQYTAEVQSNFVNYGQIRNFDRAMDAVARVAAEQRLPLGGQVTAEIISTFMRDLGRRITSGETSQIILSAEIPLLRGAGLVALEDRFQAERDLIYAARQFERRRRELFVDIAGEFLNLAARKKEIDNAEFSVRSFEEDYERARALSEAGRTDILDVHRAEQNLLVQQNNLVSTRANYETALDRLKIRLGMPVKQALILAEEEVDIPEPTVSEQEATETAILYRLDLLTELDRVADARRRTKNSANQLLPDLNLTGSATFDTDPAETNFYQFTEERVTWRGGVTLGLPVNRQRERNAYRSALIDVRRAERNYDLRADEVRQQVREAVRRYLEARQSLEIQEMNIKLAEQRREAAAVKFDLGLVGNRDKVEAEDALRDARNVYARALSDYQRAILAFRRDTGTLRIEEDGSWVELSSARR